MTNAQESNFAKAGARVQGHKYQPVINLMLAVHLLMYPVPRRAISPKQVPWAQEHKYQPVITLVLAVHLFMRPVPRRAFLPKQVSGPRVKNTSLSLP
jgi:hypothetical protein